MAEITWAPDSKALLWSGSDHKLRRVLVDNGKTEELVSSEVSNIATPQFSPDGNWISYSKQDTLLRSHVYVKPLDGGADHMIGADEFLISNGAKWTPDGKKLLLLGGALGNAFDRVINGGGVTDFINFHFWPVFNLADSAISIGVVLLLVGYLIRKPNVA